MEQRILRVKPAMRSWLRRLMGDVGAATAVEYGLILGLVVLTMIGALSQVASTTTGMWNNVSEKVIAAH